ncbi:tail fiber protein [Paenibacillus silvae]|nr:phage tail protein [Paenibacillus silvae]
MPIETKRLKLPLPLGNESVSRVGINSIFEKIDEGVATLEDLEELRQLVSEIDVPDASLTQKGIVQLSNDTESDNEQEAATLKAVKAAYDRGSEGVTAAQSAQAIINNRDGYGTTTNSGNAYTVTLTPAPTAYVDGLRITIKINSANTGAVTINVNGLGAKGVLKSNGSDLTANGIRANSVYSLVYNGTAFILQGEGGGNPITGVQTYNVPGSFTFVVPDGISRLIAHIWGGGGGGGGGSAVGWGGGGGGAGAYIAVMIPVFPGQEIPIVVGSRGLGNNASLTGSQGGTSSVGNFKAYGGGGGGGATSSASGRGGESGTHLIAGSSNSLGFQTAPTGVSIKMSTSEQILGYTGGGGALGNTTGNTLGGGGGASSGDMGGGNGAQYELGGLTPTSFFNFQGADGGKGGNGSGAATAGGFGAGGGGAGASGTPELRIGGNGGYGRVILIW